LKKTEIHIKKLEYKGWTKLADIIKYWKKHLLQKGFTEMRKSEINLLAFNKNKKIGSISGGLAIDQDEFDCEIYSLVSEINDETDLIKTELFDLLIAEFKNADFKSVCVEFYNDAEIKNFYLNKEPEFVEEIINYGHKQRISEVYGWNNIAKIKNVG